MKNRSVTYLILLLLSLVLFSCREPFTPKIDRYENLLVVDGLITDRAGPHMVRLNRTFQLEDRYPEPVEGAVVVVRDQDLQVHYFTESEPGIYESEPELKGIPGSSYQLSVVTGDGEELESDWVILQKAPSIDSLQFEIENRNTSSAEAGSPGVRICLTTHDPAGETRYYRWEWIETWEFLTPIKSSRYPDEDRCWKSVRSNRISIGTTEHLEEDRLNARPVFTIPASSNKLKIHYSAEVYQYAMSREAYSYWKNLQDLTQNTGTLFDPLPSQVRGNVYSITRNNLPVLGLFQASGVSTFRLFIERDDLPQSLNIPGGFEGCEFYTTSDSAEILYYENHAYPFVDEYVDGGVRYMIFSNSEVCFRCTLTGTNSRPDFWPAEKP